MYIGYIVGTIIAVFIIACGCVAAIHAKKNQKNANGLYGQSFLELSP